tara:strand:- start:139 stop:429 length:291 start_codon:yes stop_codon:yes gene_type:complete
MAKKNESWSEEKIKEELEKLKSIEIELKEKAADIEKQEDSLKEKLKLPEGTDIFSRLTDLITQSYNLYVSEKGTDDDISEFISKILDARKMVASND